MEAVFVAPVFDGAILGKCVRVEAATFHRQRMVHHQLGRHHRIHLRRVAALRGDRITQAGQVHQCGLTENVMAHHACWKPRKIQVLTTLDELLQRIGQCGGVAAAQQIFRQHPRGIRQPGIGARLNGVHCGTHIEVIQRSAGQRFSVGSVHKDQGRSPMGSTERASGPV